MNSSDLRYLMNLPKFEYFEPKTIEEACSLLHKYKGDAMVLAGGTDLLVSMKKREISPKYLVNIKTIPDLNYIRYNGEGLLQIGALATLNEIKDAKIVKEKFPLVAEAAEKSGLPTTRNVATMAGNLCNALPAADSAPLLICLGAKVKIQGVEGSRTMLVEDFFVDSKVNALQNGEMVTEIQVPVLPDNSAGVYLKNPERSVTDVAVVSVGTVITMDAKRAKVVDAKIVLGATAPTPMRAHKAENTIKGKTLDQELIEKAALAASKEAKPRTRPDYKRELVRVLTIRAIKQATI
ncbi:MAG: xanthine dehydrogenase family protein subunit M [Firmicutes bacterium]|nr:xanthine dehydrogenase family protein subunit M [Bacillota bacterium]